MTRPPFLGDGRVGRTAGRGGVADGEIWPFVGRIWAVPLRLAKLHAESGPIPVKFDLSRCTLQKRPPDWPLFTEIGVRTGLAEGLMGCQADVLIVHEQMHLKGKRRYGGTPSNERPARPGGRRVTMPEILPAGSDRGKTDGSLWATTSAHRFALGLALFVMLRGT